MKEFTGIEYLIRTDQDWWQVRSLSQGPDVMWVETDDSGKAEQVARPDNISPWQNPQMDNPLMDKAALAGMRTAMLDRPDLLDKMVKNEATKQAFIDGSILDDVWVEKMQQASLKTRYDSYEDVSAKFRIRLIGPELFDITNEVLVGSYETGRNGNRAVVCVDVVPKFVGDTGSTATHEWHRFPTEEVTATATVAELMVRLSASKPPVAS